MTYFKRGGGFRRGEGSDRPRFNDRGSDRPEMHSATCDQCGKQCEVPFRPNGSKPVFCSNCFEAKGGNGNSDRGFSRGNGRGSERNSDRTVYRRSDRDGGETGNKFYGASAPKPANYAEDFAAINKRLDKVMEMLLIIKQTTAVNTKKDEKAEEVIDYSQKEEITKRIKKAIKDNKEA